MLKKIDALASLLQELKNSIEFQSSIESARKSIIESIENSGTILICGNGGSATQASHMTGEFVGRFAFDRPALPAISLFDLATTTAIGNDYGYDAIFSRFVDGIGKSQDILFSLSTSGNSKNCLEAITSAKKKSIKTISLLGKDGGIMKTESDISIVIPNPSTPLIQEMHLIVIHYLCEEIEKYFFNPLKE